MAQIALNPFWPGCHLVESGDNLTQWKTLSALFCKGSWKASNSLPNGFAFCFRVLSQWNHVTCTINLYIICPKNLNCSWCSICALFKLIQSFFMLSFTKHRQLIVSLHVPLHLKSKALIERNAMQWVEIVITCILQAIKF